MTSTRILDRLVVRTLCPARATGLLQAGTARVPCALGAGGLTRTKREGDLKTPAGHWALRCVLVRTDRVRPFQTGLPVVAITPDSGWCDDPAGRSYNRPVTLPFAARTEALYRDDHIYDIIVVLSHNERPRVRGAGSAIFFHLARTGHTPTQGCIAIDRAPMLRILQRCGPQTRLHTG